MCQHIDGRRHALERLDSCVLSDALDALGLSGVVEGITRRVGVGRVLGPAVTTQLTPVVDDGARSPYHLGARAVDAAPAGGVIVIANGGRRTSGAWGGLLSRAAQRRGVAGVVIDGLCRDVDTIDHLGLTVFARGCTPVTARGRVVESAFDVPVHIGSVTIAPGDWIVADGSGVVVLPVRHLDGIVEAAGALLGAEAELAEALGSGARAQDTLAARYEGSLPALGRGAPTEEPSE